MEAIASVIPNSSKLIQKLKEDKTSKITNQQLKKELDDLKLKMSQNDCNFCGRPKQATIDGCQDICLCCSFLRCSQIVPKASAEDNLGCLLYELTEGLAPSNTPDHKDFDEIREIFLNENYPNLETGQHIHPMGPCCLFKIPILTPNKQAHMT